MARTFHPGRHELHGITVVVTTVNDEVYIGRCEDMDDEEIILLKADAHEDGSDDAGRREFIEKAARVGVWGRIDSLRIPVEELESVKRLGDVAQTIA